MEQTNSPEKRFDPFKALETDERKEVEGVETDLELGSAARFWVASINSPKYAAARLHFEHAHRDALASDDEAARNDARVEIECRAMARGLLTNFSNLECDGKPYDYSEENAYRLLRRVVHIRRLVRLFSVQITPYQYDLATDRPGKKSSEISLSGA